MLHNKEKTVGDQSSEKKVEHIDFERDLMAHNIPTIVTECVQPCEDNINWP
jgi:hypothetical protein